MIEPINIPGRIAAWVTTHRRLAAAAIVAIALLTTAGALLCLEGRPEFWSVQRALFQRASHLTRDDVLDLAGAAYGDRAGLQSCIDSKETRAKLEEDLAYAEVHDIHGTPLVLLNGLEVEPQAPLIYALILAKGDVDAPEFKVLPPDPDAPPTLISAGRYRTNSTTTSSSAGSSRRPPPRRLVSRPAPCPTARTSLPSSGASTSP